MLVAIVENDHFALLPSMIVVRYPQETLVGHKERKVAAQFQVARSKVRLDVRLGRHRAEERVAERRSHHQTLANRLSQKLCEPGTVLLEEILIGGLASLYKVHPFPLALVQTVLFVKLGVVVTALISLS